MFNFFLSHSPILYFTQSLWRDEAFSILTAERPIGFFLTKLGLETPLYYTLLHFWIKLFGESEIAVRSLSFLGFILATIVVIAWSEKLFKKHFLSWFLPVLFFFNPMLLYYAFEARAYAWYVLFTVLSLYTYTTKRWLWFTVSTILGFYTHSYFLIVPFVETIHYLVAKNVNWKTFWKDAFVKSMSMSALVIVPWLIKITFGLSQLKSSWYFPVNFNLVRSVLGNMFIGYEGTPGYLWGFTAFVSLVLVALFVWAMKPVATRKRNALFLFLIGIPLAIVIGISFKKPLFVNRYLIPVTVGEVILLALAIETLPRRWMQILCATVLLLFSIFFDTWYPPLHAKLNIRATLMQVNVLKTRDDVIFAASPLIFFETIYYSTDRTKVFLYNPMNGAFPWYVGDIIVSRNQFARSWPTYPMRAFLVHEDGSYEIVYQTHAGIAKQVQPKSLTGP